MVKRHFKDITDGTSCASDSDGDDGALRRRRSRKDVASDVRKLLDGMKYHMAKDKQVSHFYSFTMDAHSPAGCSKKFEPPSN